MPRSKFKKQSHCTYLCIYHLVLGTKYRRRIFNAGVLAYLKERLKEVVAHYPELDIVQINHDEDHIHLVLWIPPKMAVSKAVNIIKSNAARHLKEKFPFLKEVYWGTDSVWSDGYCVSTVGLNEDVIRKYVEKQGQEDAGQAQLEML